MKKILTLLFVLVLTGCGKWYADYGLEKDQLTTPEAIPSLIKALSSDDLKTRNKALSCLGRNNNRSIIGPVKKVAGNDPHPNNRTRAINVLLQVLDPDESKAYLTKQYKENSQERVRQYAARQLKNLVGSVGEPPTSIVISENESIDFGIEPQFKFFNGLRTLNMRKYMLLPIEFTVKNNSNHDIVLDGEKITLKTEKSWVVEQAPVQRAVDSMRLGPRASNFVFPWTIRKTVKANVKIRNYCTAKHIGKITIPPDAAYSGILFFRITRDTSSVNGWTVNISVQAGEPAKVFRTKYIFG